MRLKPGWKRALAVFLATLTGGCGGGITPGASERSGSYSSTFPAAENPISESGKWVNGGVVGLDWANVLTTPDRAVGNETGANFSDATAILQTLNWTPDQKASGVVSTTGLPLDSCSQEVELRLRTVISAHSITGYEVNYKFSTNSTGYMQIVRWDGEFANFTVLLSLAGQQYGVTNGDTVSATVVGNQITAYKNGVQQGQVTDSTYASGSPGMGFNLDNSQSGCSGTNPSYGFSSFTAVDSTQGSF